MRELIKIEYRDDNALVSARELHEFLEVKSRFNDWIKNRITKYGFEEETDYTKTMIGKNRGQSIYDYIVTINVAKELCKTECNIKSEMALKQLLNVDDKEILYIKPTRKEIEFGEMLDKITGFTFDKQYPIDGGKYRLDFILKNTLIVEYDEKHHAHKYTDDLKRIEYCIEWLSKNEGYNDGWRYPVIRVKEGEEFEGLNRIIRHLAGFEMFDTQYNYNLQVCDY